MDVPRLLRSPFSPCLPFPSKLYSWTLIFQSEVIPTSLLCQFNQNFALYEELSSSCLFSSSCLHTRLSKTLNTLSTIVLVLLCTTNGSRGSLESGGFLACWKVVAEQQVDRLGINGIPRLWHGSMYLFRCQSVLWIKQVFSLRGVRFPTVPTANGSASP